MRKFEGMVVDPARFMYLAHGRLEDGRTTKKILTPSSDVVARVSALPVTLPKDTLLERVYCVSCGGAGGLVFNVSYIVWQCDSCFATYGPLALPSCPDEVAEGKVIRHGN